MSANLPVGDFPTLVSSASSCAVYNGINDVANWVPATWGSDNSATWGTPLPTSMETLRRVQSQQTVQHKKELGAVADKVVRRFARVIIVDPNENVPLEDAVLFNGDEKLTDATDQELFFEIDVKGLLDKHNEKRTKIVDKSVKDRTEYLPAARMRDLKMVVINGATF